MNQDRIKEFDQYPIKGAKYDQLLDLLKNQHKNFSIY